MALASGACYGQPDYVEAPEVVKLPHGLFSVANIIEGGVGHWQMGVEYEPYSCATANRYPCPTCVQNNANTAPAKTYTSGVPLVQAFPFTVYGSFKCSPIGNWERGFDRAMQHLLNGEERAVEVEVALGGNHNSNFLSAAASFDATPTPGTALTVAEGVAVLEQYIGANNAGRGTILMTRREASLAYAQRALVGPTGEVLYTALSTPVAALSGYTGATGPNAVAAGAGEAWVFATGPITIRRSEVFMTPPNREEALKRFTNDFEVLAERTYVVDWPCITAGVLVTSV